MLHLLVLPTIGLHLTRCAAPRMQQPARQIAVRALQSQADLRAALEATPQMGISLLMLSSPDCAKAAKVKKFLLERGTPNPRVQHLSLELLPDDADSWRGFRGTDPARTPHCIAYDAEGARVADFVAMTPGALFYGLEDLGGVLAATEAERARDEQRESAAFAPPPGMQTPGTAPGTAPGVPGTAPGTAPGVQTPGTAPATAPALAPAEARLAALEGLVSRLTAELSAQQAALGAATLRIAALEEAAGGAAGGAAGAAARRPPEAPVPKDAAPPPPPPPAPVRKARGSIGDSFSDTTLGDGSGRGFVIY